MTDLQVMYLSALTGFLVVVFIMAIAFGGITLLDSIAGRTNFSSYASGGLIGAGLMLIIMFHPT